MRILPDFIIIGAQRCGITSLYSRMIQHPYIVPALLQEVAFFSNHFGKGLNWYRAHFPTFLYKRYVRKIRRQDFITGEATGNYILNPHTPKRIFDTIPQVKLIALLRNPVDRAYSHYQLNAGWGVETLSFEDAIDREAERVRGEMEKVLEDEYYYSINQQFYSYLSKGIYVDQLRAWMSLFPRDQVLILKSEELFSDPPRILKQVFEFLNLPDWKLKEYREYNYADCQEMNPLTRRRLVNYFRPHNQRLYEYLGIDFGWDR